MSLPQNHPQQLGKYPLTEILGEGAMGVVYKGFDPGIHRPVAIKTIRKSLAHDEHDGTPLAARFKNEAQAVGRLLHPGIVAIYEYGEDGDTAFIAMEFVEGQNLSQILAGNPVLPEPVVLRVMEQLLDALACAHQNGVWHRDIKPANLIITTAGQLKVTDFGVARIEANALTQVPSTIGTPGYMAPEQYIGDGIDHRADLYACGVLLYRLLTGHAPFTGTAEAIMYKTLQEMPPPPSHEPGLNRSPRFDAIVARAMAKEPKQRFASAAEFRDALMNRTPAPSLAALDHTIIAPKLAVGAPREPAGSAIAGASRTGMAGVAGTGTAMTAWDPDALSQIERVLARFMGPVAKVLVRQAARSCVDIDALQHALAQHIPTAEDRPRFIALVGPAMAVTASRASAASAASRSSVTALGHPSQASQPSAGTQTAATIPAEIQEHAQKVLTSHIGPIAKVVLRKALPQARSSEHLYQLLADSADGPDRAKLLADLRRKM